MKGTLGVLASLLLAATTEPHDVIRGLERLRMPAQLVQILAFMVRYLDVVGDEMRRMRIALASRGFTARNPRHWPVIARSAGALFIRSYERGERVHLAMLSRGHAPGERACTPVLDVRGLAHVYPDGHQALYGVDLHVHRGERVALLGPNGAGKTTLVLHLNGILVPSAGAVSGLRAAGAKPNLQEVRRRVGIVFQDPDDQLFMPTVRDDVAFGPRNLGLRGAELDRRVVEALDQVGMAEFVDRPPHHLSFGQRRRVAVATVLAMRAGDPGARRAVVEPRPGVPAGARGHPAEPRRHRADGHPRPALRPRALPALGDPLRRRRGRRRTDAGRCSPTTS